jgi:hypothetical protein
MGQVTWQWFPEVSVLGQFPSSTVCRLMALCPGAVLVKLHGGNVTGIFPSPNMFSIESGWVYHQHSKYYLHFQIFSIDYL